jgi:hypothetical protein
VEFSWTRCASLAEAVADYLRTAEYEYDQDCFANLAIDGVDTDSAFFTVRGNGC